MAGSDELLFRMIPDLDMLAAQLANQDPNWVTITFRGIGEMVLGLPKEPKALA